MKHILPWLPWFYAWYLWFRLQGGCGFVDVIDRWNAQLVQCAMRYEGQCALGCWVHCYPAANPRFWEKNSVARINLFCNTYEYKSSFFRSLVSKDVTVLHAGVIKVWFIDPRPCWTTPNLMWTFLSNTQIVGVVIRSSGSINWLGNHPRSGRRAVDYFAPLVQSTKHYDDQLKGCL